MEEVDLRKVLERLMAFVLVVTLATSSVSINSFSVKAEEVSKKEEKTEVGSNINSDGYCKPEVVEKVVSDRTTDSTTFLLSNRMKQTTYYSDDIYFENEKGELAEYDSEFVKLDKNDRKQVTNSVEVSGNEKDKYSYVNNEGDSKQFLPNKLSEKTPIVMAKKDYVLSFAPTEIEEGSEVKTSSVKYSYDSKGNRILSTDDDKKTSTVYKYDVSNQLVYVETTVNGAITFKQHNEYNGQGQRISKTDTDIGGDKVNSETTNYYYEGSLLLYTTDGNGNKTSQNLIGNENNAFATIRYDSDVQSEYFYSKEVQEQMQTHGIYMHIVQEIQ